MSYEFSSILSWIIFLPAIGAGMLMLLPAGQVRIIRGTAFGVSLLTAILAGVAAWIFNWSVGGPYGANVQLKQDFTWIQSLNVHYFVGADGLSMPLVLLTAGVALLACVASLSIEKQVKAYFVLFLLLLSGMLGVFLSLDLLLFFMFFELSLIPIYFLIGIWGGGGKAGAGTAGEGKESRKEFAAIKFLLFALVGSTTILVVVLGLYFHVTKIPGKERGTWNLITLATDGNVRNLFSEGSSASPGAVAEPTASKPAIATVDSVEKAAAIKFAGTAFWLILAGFALRLPAIPLHTWLPVAHAEAPTPISMMLSGAFLQMAGYGLLRVAYAIFPQQAADNWFWVALIAVTGILYGALCAMAQKDLKRLLAYWSITQMSYVLLGIAVMNQAGTNGALFQLIASGISSALLFYAVGVIEDRAHHRDISRLGGLAAQMPTFSGFAIIGFLAAMGLPGLCSFVAQLLVLLGTFRALDSNGVIMLASAGWAYRPLVVFGLLTASAVVLSAGCLLWTLQRIFWGPPRPEYHFFTPLTIREKLVLTPMTLAAIAFGILPGFLLLDRIKPTVDAMLKLLG